MRYNRLFTNYLHKYIPYIYRRFYIIHRVHLIFRACSGDPAILCAQHPPFTTVGGKNWRPRKQPAASYASALTRNRPAPPIAGQIDFIITAATVCCAARERCRLHPGPSVPARQSACAVPSQSCIAAICTGYTQPARPGIYSCQNERRPDVQDGARVKGF